MSSENPPEKPKTSDVIATPVDADRGNRLGDFVVDVVKNEGAMTINVIILPGTPKSRAFGPIEEAALAAIQGICGTRTPPRGFQLFRLDQDQIKAEGGEKLNFLVEDMGIDDSCDALSIHIPAYYVRSRNLKVEEIKDVFTTNMNQLL